MLLQNNCGRRAGSWPLVVKTDRSGTERMVRLTEVDYDGLESKAERLCVVQVDPAWTAEKAQQEVLIEGRGENVESEACHQAIELDWWDGGPSTSAAW